MGARVLGVENKVITIELVGRLSHAELAAVQQQQSALIRELGEVCFLILAQLFAGWEQDGNWGDLSFQSEHDPYIKKIAIVADQKWEGLALLFAGKGVRRPSIEFFPSAELAKARLWLVEAS